MREIATDGSMEFTRGLYAIARKEAVTAFKAVVTLSSGNPAQGGALASRLRSLGRLHPPLQ